MPIKAQRDEDPVLNLTSMIDIVFLLIIFFMVGSRFTDFEHSVEVKVPQVSDIGALTPAPEKRVVNVYRDGRIALDRTFVSLNQLTAELSAAHREYEQLGVIVRGDAEGQFQNVADVLSACRRAGVSDMGISVRLAKKE